MNRFEEMTEKEARRWIVEIGRRMYQRGYAAANSGNISIRIGSEIICTPAGVSKGYMTEDMMVRVDMDGRALDGGNASSELKMHLRVYALRRDVFAVTHAHPPVATAFAVAGIPLDRPLLAESVIAFGSVPVAKYATTGTDEVPESIAPYIPEHEAVLLANHGALTWGRDILEAWFRLEELEHLAAVTLNTRLIGTANELSPAQVEELIGLRK